MRRQRITAGPVWAAVAGAVLLLGAGIPAAAASPTPTRGTPVCDVRGDRLTEISGMAATDDGFVMVNDGADDESRRRIFFLDAECAVVRSVPYPSQPRDTEDLAVGADGTVWVADIGDNGRSRRTIGVWKLPPGADRPVLYRMAYPDGPHDAEALLVTRDDRPIIVTKYSATLYTPTVPLRAGVTVPLARVGQVRLPASTTSNPFSVLGRTAVTGAAGAPDGRTVVLRTYADAYEFDVGDRDLVAALTGGTPRITALPDEPQGESIAYTRDGTALLTVSETADQPPGTRPTVLRYRPGGTDGSAPAQPTTGPAQVTSGPEQFTRGPSARAAGVARAPVVAAVAAGLGVGVLVLATVALRRRARSR